MCWTCPDAVATSYAKLEIQTEVDGTFFFEGTAMQLLCAFSLVLALMIPGGQAAATKPAAQTPAAPGAAAAKGGRTVNMTGGDDMKFNLTTIEAKPGETIRVVLKNIGTVPKIAMAHNFVLLTLTADVNEYAKAAMMAQATEYLPPAEKAKVLASTKMAGPGETVEVSFKAPAKAGSYPYLCTFPGHYAAGMKGTLVVK
jgi:azurin